MDFHMQMHSRVSVGDQVAGAVVRSATSHSVGALLKGHSTIVVLLIAAALILCVWAFRRFF